MFHDSSFWSVKSSKAPNPLSISDFDRKCSVCNKQIRDVVKSIPCQICHCLIHQRCSGFQPWESANYSKALRYWSCKQCYVDQFPFAKLETNELTDLTFNSNFICPCRHSCIDIQDYQLLERLELCKLNPSEHDPLYNNDIDNHVRFHDNFDYFSNHKFHKLIRNIRSSGKERFSLLHSNILSLLGNFDKLENLLLDLDSDFDILALSETWHSKSNDARFKNLSIPGFHKFVGLQGNSKNGGCGFFIKESLNFHDRNDLSKSFKSEKCEFEAEWVEIVNAKGANVVSGVIYNHPRRDPTQFLDYLNITLKKLTKENKLILVSGDFNLDLLAYDKRPIVEEFLNITFANCLQPLILQPSRYTDSHKPSLIDNIFINSIENNVNSGNIISKISDHMPNFVILDKMISKSKYIPQFKRDFTKFNESDFVSDFDSAELLPHNTTDLDEKFQHFQNSVLKSINKHAPLKKLSNRQAKLRKKPWITSGILKSISIKNKLYKRFLKSKDKFWYQR